MKEKELLEIEQLYEMWRHRDNLYWASAPVSIIVSGVLVGIAYGYIPDSKPMVRSLVLVLTIIWTASMFIMICKNELFIRGTRERLRKRDFNVPLYPTPKDVGGLKFIKGVVVFKLMFLMYIMLISVFCYMLVETLIRL